MYRIISITFVGTAFNITKKIKNKISIELLLYLEMLLNRVDNVIWNSFDYSSLTSFHINYVPHHRSFVELISLGALNVERGDYLLAEGQFALLDYGSISMAARADCSTVISLDNNFIFRKIHEDRSGSIWPKSHFIAYPRKENYCSDFGKAFYVN
jgi:hypothetical protein